MQVNFYSRADAKEFIETRYFARKACDFISISDTHSEAKEMKKLWLANKQDTNAAIFLSFQDISDRYSGFTENKADTIVKFVAESYAKKKDVLVHCFLGVSRSGAVAKFINEYYKLGNQYLENYTMHNLWVYHTLLERAGVPTLRQYYANLEKQDGKSS